MADRVLITGGAGFLGASLAVALAADGAGTQVVAFDNLRRRGSELNLPRLRAAGVTFVHGDVRDPGDLVAVGPVDALVECSAEPSVLAGLDGSTAYPVHTNLVGAYNCLEYALRHDAHVVFCSTSRVYPVAHLSALRHERRGERFVLVSEQPLPGASEQGVAETFPLDGARTLYGTTKLAAEMLVEEYRAAFGLSATVDRFGVIAGPWQMGKVDQGVFTYWLLAHRLGRPLEYLGFGGNGLQVRDLLHVDDAVELLIDQVTRREHWDGFVGNAGGGVAGSLSLAETTELCRRITGREVAVARTGTSRPGDVPVYVSDCSRLYARSAWRPSHTPEDVLRDIDAWVADHEAAVVAAL